MSEAVELCYRLPRLWALVQGGRLQAWKARQVARATTQLSSAAVAFVDRHLAVTARSNRVPAVNPVLHEARLRCDPDQAAAVEQNALEHRGVWLDHRECTATTLVTARLDTLDALDLDGTVSDLASLLGRLGDHRGLDLAAGTDAEAAEVDSGSDRSGLNGSRGTLYLHVSLSDLAVDAGGGRVEKLGTASLTLLAGLAAAGHRGHRPAGARPRDPPGPALRVPRLPRPCAGLRPRPPRALRRARPGRAAGPDGTGEPRLPVPQAPPREDLRRLALPAAPRSRVR